MLELSESLAGSLLDVQQLSKPVRLQSKLAVTFHPSRCRPIDFVPVIGEASRTYQPISRRSTTAADVSGLQSPHAAHAPQTVQNKRCPFVQAAQFKLKTDVDTRGCKPTGVTVSALGEIIIVDDINRKIKIFSSKGALVGQVAPTGDSALIDPWDITMTHYGNFVVTDKGSKSVKIFDREGDVVSEFGEHLLSPWGVCANSLGQLIVTDTAHRSVFIHDTIGNLRAEVSAPRDLIRFPEYVTNNQHDDIIVSDFRGNSVYVFNLLGQFLLCIKSWQPTGHVFESPCGVTCDDDDNIILADFENARVCEFTATGQFVQYALSKKNHIRGPQCVSSPRAAGSTAQQLVVVDGTNVKIFHRNRAVTLHDASSPSAPGHAGAIERVPSIKPVPAKRKDRPKCAAAATDVRAHNPAVPPRGKPPLHEKPAALRPGLQEKGKPPPERPSAQTTPSVNEPSSDEKVAQVDSKDEPESNRQAVVNTEPASSKIQDASQTEHNASNSNIAQSTTDATSKHSDLTESIRSTDDGTPAIASLQTLQTITRTDTFKNRADRKPLIDKIIKQLGFVDQPQEAS